MIVRRLVILSGIESRVADRLGPALRSAAMDIAFVKIGADGLSADYFARLVQRTLDVAERVMTRPDVKLLGLLISCASTNEQELEREHFFPALRRLEIPREYRRDANQFSEVQRRVRVAFQSVTYEKVVREASPQREDRLLLPVRNSKLERLKRHFVEIYELRQAELSRRLMRDIPAVKKGRGYRIRDADFKGAINDGTHPVRRCTDTPTCDLGALMRFGVPVPERFEFDVSCATGLASKTFCLCDGTPMKIPAGTSHLNMRINDDFMAA